QGRVVATRPVAEVSPGELARLMVGDRAAPPAAERLREPGERVLELRGVRCAGRGGLALDGCDLVVRRGEIVGVAGVAGNGQAELAEVAAGLRRPEEGERLAETRAVGFIPEDRLGTGLVQAMAISENLGLRRFGRPP